MSPFRGKTQICQGLQTHFFGGNTDSFLIPPPLCFLNTKSPTFLEIHRFYLRKNTPFSRIHGHAEKGRKVFIFVVLVTQVDIYPLPKECRDQGLPPPWASSPTHPEPVLTAPLHTLQTNVFMLMLELAISAPIKISFYIIMVFIFLEIICSIANKFFT